MCDPSVIDDHLDPNKQVRYWALSAACSLRHNCLQLFQRSCPHFEGWYCGARQGNAAGCLGRRERGAPVVYVCVLIGCCHSSITQMERASHKYHTCILLAIWRFCLQVLEAVIWQKLKAYLHWQTPHTWGASRHHRLRETLIGLCLSEIGTKKKNHTKTPLMCPQLKSNRQTVLYLGKEGPVTKANVQKTRVYKKKGILENKGRGFVKK